MVEILSSADASLPTGYGLFRIFVFKADNGLEHVAIIGKVKKPENVLVRLHSECLTGDVFTSKRCDCNQQLVKSLKIIGKEGGILVYLRQEGRGIGLLNKIRAYALQEKGLDTVDANTHLGFNPDERDYEIAAIILKHLGIKSIRLLTNNPDKIKSLAAHGIKISERVPLPIKPTAKNRKYLAAKKKRMGHLL